MQFYGRLLPDCSRNRIGNGFKREVRGDVGIAPYLLFMSPFVGADIGCLPDVRFVLLTPTVAPAIISSPITNVPRQFISAPVDNHSTIVV